MHCRLCKITLHFRIHANDINVVCLYCFSSSSHFCLQIGLYEWVFYVAQMACLDEQCSLSIHIHMAIWVTRSIWKPTNVQCLFVCLFVYCHAYFTHVSQFTDKKEKCNYVYLACYEQCLFVYCHAHSQHMGCLSPLNSLRAENKLCSSAGSSHDPTFVVTTALDNTSKTDVVPWCYKWIGLVGIRVGWSILAGFSHFFVEDMYWNDRSLLTELPESSSRSVTGDHFQCNPKK